MPTKAIKKIDEKITYMLLRRDESPVELVVKAASILPDDFSCYLLLRTASLSAIKIDKIIKSINNKVYYERKLQLDPIKKKWFSIFHSPQVRGIVIIRKPFSHTRISKRARSVLVSNAVPVVLPDALATEILE